MALVKNKKAFIGAVSTIVGADMGIQDLLFPKARPRNTKLIEYDYATIEGASADYHSFAETAKVVDKDGKSVIILAPLNFNESISKDEIYANASKFGENEYGEGSIDAVTESALNGVAKLSLRALIGTKRAIYQALTTHKIAGGYKGKDGAEDIVFNTPAANIEVLTNTAPKLYWTNSSSTPLDNLYAAYESMIVKPTMAVMNSALYSYFYDNAQIRTADNTSTGLKKNYTLNEGRNAEGDFFKAGTVQYKDMMLDIYVERGTYKDSAGTDVQFLTDGFVVLASRGNGTTEFGGIPVAKQGEGVVNISAEFDVQEIVTQNPPVHELVHRTAPLPLLKNGNAFYSMKVTA